MRHGRTFGCGAILVAGMVGTIAFAQPEQWLQYHTGTNPRGYRWVNLTNTPPRNVPLPSLGQHRYFGQWQTGLDPAGARWFCLDRTRKTGPCDRLFFDRNGNGRLDDETPLKAVQREESSACFDPVRVVFRGEDGPITYHLICRFYDFENRDARMLLGSGGWYEGKVQLGGRKRQIELIDYTVNGVFNDQAPSPYDSDRIVLDADQEEEKSVDRYLGRWLELEGGLFQIDVARDGAFLKVRKAENVPSGKVRVPEAISEFIAVGTNGHFVRTPVKGEFTLPVGGYRVHHWTLDRKDDQGAAWRLVGYGFSEFASFEASAAQTAKLDIGEPVRAVFGATQSKGKVDFSLRLQGSLGESVEIMRGESRPRAPQLHVASLVGTFRSTNNFQYG